MSVPNLPLLILTATVLAAGLALSQNESAAAAINGVKGVKQEAVESVKVPAPPAPIPPQTAGKVAPVPKVEGVQAPVKNAPPTAAPPPPPPPAPSAAQGINKAEGMKAAGANAIQGLPPPPAGAVAAIRAVQGVQGIVSPKQRNLEAALLMKEDGKGTPAGGGAEGGKGKAAAAAALLSGPPDAVPAPPVPNGDGRAAFQEFEKQSAPGS